MIDVVFVDDELEFAQDLAKLTSETLGLTVSATDDPDEALRLVKEAGVKIVVLDQKMPRPGVELGKQIHELDKRVRRILLSGEASPGQVTSAYDSGFDRNIHKNDTSTQLPEALRRALLQYEMSLRREVANSPITLPSVILSLLPSWPRIRYKLLSIDSIDNEFIISDSWITRAKVDAGETKKEATTLKWVSADEIKYQVDDTTSLSAKLGAGKGVRAEAALKREIAKKASLQASRSQEETVTLERTLSLPPEDSDPTQLRIAARAYEVAPVYQKVSVSVGARCTCCSNDELVKADYYVSRRSFATRQINYLSDGTEQSIWTGIETS